MAKYAEDLTWAETVNIFYSDDKTIKYLSVQDGLVFGEYGLNMFNGYKIGKEFKSNYLDHDYVLNNYYGVHLFMCGGGNWNSL